MHNFGVRLFLLLFLTSSITHAAAPDVFVNSMETLRQDAFRDVTGMTEDDFTSNLRANIARVVTVNDEDQYWVKNVVTNREWYAGKFLTASIQELRNQIDARPIPGNRRTKRRHIANGKFNVIAGFTPQNLSIAQQKRCNVTALQANREHKRAVFQVASNFNCLEGAGPSLTNWTRARAQGELAGISALPGSLVRRYCLDPIDLLSNLRHVAFRLQGADINKHLDFTRAAERALTEAAGFDETQVQMGIHLEAPITFGLVRAGERGAVRHHTTCKYFDDDRGQNVIQIYTSAVNLRLNNRRNFTPAAYAHVETIAKKMIKASYEGTLLAAAFYGEQPNPEIDNKQQEVFLTLMGCGAFNNKLEWVAEALEELINDIQELNLDVTLIVFDGSAAGMDGFLPRMQALTEQTGGNYEELRPEDAKEAPTKKDSGGCLIM